MNLIEQTAEVVRDGRSLSRAVNRPSEGLSLAPSIEKHEGIRWGHAGIVVGLLTGGTDRPYVFGLATSLLAHGVRLEIVGGDELNIPELGQVSRITFLNLRGSSDPHANFLAKIRRILGYYGKLIAYAATAKPAIFHILWNNKFEALDRTFLMLYYKLLRKKIVLTVHNVNMKKRDGNDTIINRLTLRIQYRLANHLFAHTEKMKTELIEEFGVPSSRITVIPFGINISLSSTSLTSEEAKHNLALGRDQKVILFFGRITPYKGLEYLIAAFKELAKLHPEYRLVIAGRVDRCEAYWKALREDLEDQVPKQSILIHDTFVPDSEAEIYFKASDVLILPYRDIYQSGVFFTGQQFGIPILAADVGSLREEIVEGETGFVFRPEDPVDLARAIDCYFNSDLYVDLNNRRHEIREYAMQRHSWERVSELTLKVHAELLGIPTSEVVDAFHSDAGF